MNTHTHTYRGSFQMFRMPLVNNAHYVLTEQLETTVFCHFVLYFSSWNSFFFRSNICFFLLAIVAKQTFHWSKNWPWTAVHQSSCCIFPTRKYSWHHNVFGPLATHCKHCLKVSSLEIYLADQVGVVEFLWGHSWRRMWKCHLSLERRETQFSISVCVNPSGDRQGSNLN